MPDFRFDHAKLRQIARDQWGIRWPIHVSRRPYRRWFGSHGIWPKEPGQAAPTHVMRIRNAALRVMLATLAHEMEHACQTERLGRRKFARVYRRDPELMEAEAEAAEERWREFLPAIRPTGGVDLSELL